MAGKFRCTFDMEIDVKFENPQVAEDYFVRGEWGNCFYHLDDLEDVAKSLSWAFHNEDDRWDGETRTFFRNGKANVTVKKTQSGPVMSMEAAELMRIEGEWHSLAIWGDTRNQTWLGAGLRVEA